MKKGQKGSIFVNNGLWYYSVKLPGEDKRRQVPLKVAGSDRTLTADRPRRLAEEAAARYWESKTKGDNAPRGRLVEDIVSAYLAHASLYYRHADGTETSEVAGLRIGLRMFRKMYGSATVGELVHRDMIAHRDALERSGISRTTVNKRIGMVKRMWTWALEEGLITPAERVELSQASNLKPGRSIARETEPVRPVDDETLRLTLAEMLPNTADMVRVQRLTGMRPEEVCAIKWSLIDTSAEPWVYRPAEHKNSWRGMPRVVCIGPRAREILSRHREDDVPFSPKIAMTEFLRRRAESRADARRHVATDPDTIAEGEAKRPHVPRKLNDEWCTDSYTGTIAAACRKAGISSWGSNRLRHAFATDVRRRFGLEVCRAVLGHSGGGCVTDRYSFDAIEEEIIRTAAPAVEALG